MVALLQCDQLASFPCASRNSKKAIVLSGRMLVLYTMEMQCASEIASPVDAATGSAGFCLQDAKSCAVLDGSQSQVSQNATGAPDSSTLVDSISSTRSPKKGSLAHLDVTCTSSASSATASPISTNGTPLAAQEIHEKVPPATVAAANMKDLSKKKYCEYPGCKVQPTFNFPGERGGSHCGSHRLEGQINTVNKMCEVPGCFVRPSFKFPIRGAASQRCARHKLPGMVGNSGKSSLPQSPAISEAKTPGDECKTTTPKRARGELLKIQREQMMLMLGDNGAASAAVDCETKMDMSSPLSAAASCKRMKHPLATPPAGDSELAILGGICGDDFGSTSKVQLQKALGVAAAALTASPTTLAPSSDIAKEKKSDGTGGSLQFSPLLKIAADSGILNLKSSLTSQSSLPLFAHQSHQQAGPFPSPAVPASLSAFQSDLLPYNIGTSCGSFISNSEYNQALLALSAMNSSLWGPLTSMNPFPAPFLPSLSPWATADLSFLPTLSSAFHPSTILNPAALSSRTMMPQFPQMSATSSADPSKQAAASTLPAAMPSETHSVPKNVELR